MQSTEAAQTKSLKERALEELKAYWFITLYLWLFLGCFTVYRRLILAESGVAYLNYGVALIEALVIAKVVLIGCIFGFTRRFDDAPLAVPVLHKSIVFALLVMLFGVVEHLVVGWFHKQGPFGSLHEIAETGAYEIGARADAHRRLRALLRLHRDRAQDGHGAAARHVLLFPGTGG